MQAGQAQVKAITTSNYTNVSTFKFKISAANQGYVTNGSYYLKSYMVLTGSSNSGPVCTKQSDDGTKIIWTSMNSGEYWNIHSYYNSWFADRYPALYYKDSKYDGYMKHNGGIDYSSTKDTQTGTEYRWYLVSQAQLDRHFAIYFFDAYKESLNIAQYENNVPAAYYTALQTAYNQTFSVQNAAHSAEVVNVAKTNLETLYNGAADIAAAYATTTAAINALEAIEDKGEDFAEVTADITNARTALEQAMSVEAVNAAVAGLKAVDPITFNVTEFTALQPLGTPASTTAGRAITYEAADKKIINAAGLPVYKGTTTLKATAAATAEYYKFVRSAEVKVNGVDNTGEDSRVICEGETAEYNGDQFTEPTVKEYTFTNITGGDSIVTLTVVVNKPSATNEEMTIVYGTEGEWNGYDLSQQAVGTRELVYRTTNVFGCDSIVTLALIVNKQETLNVPVELAFCEGGSEVYRGVVYTEAGTFEVPAEGITRDTLYVVNVTVNKPSATNEEMTIVYGTEGEWNGYDLSEYAVGTYQLNYKTENAAGCDSLVTLALTVTKQETLNVPVTLNFCDGESAEYRGTTYTEAGEFAVPATGDVRDTVYNVTVVVYPVYAITENKTIVVGAEQTWEGQNLSQLAVGDHTLTAEYQTIHGCDSVMTLKLIVTKQEVVEIPVDFTFCEGGSAEFRGTTYTEAGLYPVHVEGEVSDTVYNVTVTVNMPTASNEEMTIAYGTAAEWNDYDLSEYAVGTYELNYTTTNAAGCDSIVTLALTVEKLETLELEPVLLGFCPDDSVEYRGKWYTESVEDTLLVEGEIRDTLIYVTAVVLPTSYEVLYDTVNAGEIILLPEGEWTLGETVVSGEYATTEEDMPELVFVLLDKTDDGCEARTDLIVTVEPRNTEGVEAVSAGEKAQKFFHNGVIYFRRGEHIYTTDGKVVE